MGFVFEVSCVLSAFYDNTIGTKVTNAFGFAYALNEALEAHDRSRDQVVGQHFVRLSESARSTVSAGVGRRSGNSDDYVVRMHRGQPSLFLKREFAAQVEGVAVVVYTKEAYLNDPDTREDREEWERISASSCTHVIVAVLAFAGPPSPLTPYRLVHNLGGGNNEVDAWTKDEIVAKAKESLAYWNEWVVVAD